MTKRERLTKQLKDKESLLWRAGQALTCDCICHTSPVEVLHFEACCSGLGVDIPSLEEEISKLKKKLRK